MKLIKMLILCFIVGCGGNDRAQQFIENDIDIVEITDEETIEKTDVENVECPGEYYIKTSLCEKMLSFCVVLDGGTFVYSCLNYNCAIPAAQCTQSCYEEGNHTVCKYHSFLAERRCLGDTIVKWDENKYVAVKYCNRDDSYCINGKCEPY